MLLQRLQGICSHRSLIKRGEHLSDVSRETMLIVHHVLDNILFFHRCLTANDRLLPQHVELGFLSRYLFLGLSYCVWACNTVYMLPSKSDIVNEQVFVWELKTALMSHSTRHPDCSQARSRSNLKNLKSIGSLP